MFSNIKNNISSSLYLIKGFKKKFYLLSILLLFGSILEIVSIGSILPLLTLLADPDLLYSNNYTLYFINIFNLNDFSKLFYYLLTFIFFTFFIRFIFFIFLTRYKNYFCFELYSNLSKKLSNIYLKQDYLFYKKRNSSELINLTLTEVGNFVNGIISSYLNIFIEVLIGLFILVFLFKIQFISTLFILLFLLLISILYFKKFKKKINILAEQKLFTGKKRIQNLQEGFSGIKEIKLFGIENIISSNFDEINSKFLNIIKNENNFQTYPRIFLEFLFIICFIFVLYIMLLHGFNFNKIILQVSFFTIASIKIIPVVHKIVSSIQTIKFTTPVLEKLIKEFNLATINIERSKNQKLYIENNIEIKNLNFKYDNSNKRIIQNLSFKTNRNKVIGIFGESGCGKSTLFDLLLGFLLPESGEIFIDGKNLRQNISGWQKNIGYVPQSIFLKDGSILSNILLDRDVRDIEEILKTVALDEIIKELPNGINTLVGEKGEKFSGGQRQRIGIARALFGEPEVILLDEATSSLDIDLEKRIIKSIINIKSVKNIIMITHRRETLLSCDNTYEMKNGILIPA